MGARDVDRLGHGVGDVPELQLLLVEAPSADIEALTAAMQTAIAQGATVVSNSYTTPETAAVAADNSKWNHPGVPIVAGAGDNGYGVGWPARPRTRPRSAG